MMNPQTDFTGDPFLSDLERENIKNFCSWLLNFNEYELPLITYGIAVLLAETFTNEATGRKVKVKKANEVTASVSESLKVQQRYDSETGTYDFRFVAGINTVDVDKAKITITLNGFSS